MFLAPRLWSAFRPIPYGVISLLFLHSRRMGVRSVTLLLSALVLLRFCGYGAEIFIRANQVGYRPNDPKIAIAFSSAPLPETFVLVETNGARPVLYGKTKPLHGAEWAGFAHHAVLDFSDFHSAGVYRLRVNETESWPFTICERAYGHLPDELLEFMRQQRCGYNPWLEAGCHSLDGRSAYGPLTNGSPVDARGGWHDAADLLKYLLTSGNATAQMLLAYQIGAQSAPRAYKVQSPKYASPQTTEASCEIFGDRVDATGRPGRNGIPDLLDEARWGLEWMLKLHPAPGQLYHQVADDRDHVGRRLPQNETVDYGWGKGGARVVYFADGRPQGLREYQSESTGVANLAGRYAAAMGLAYQIWKGDVRQRRFAERCLRAGQEVYELGRAREGVQQGNSYRAPYRYEEATWADDMEWGAAELYRATGRKSYLEQAKRYAKLAADESWMGKETARHYQYYPFMNAGHFRLYDLVGAEFKPVLAEYYRSGIERCERAAQRNPYQVGMPFIWCSDNLAVALATQCLFYERMTGDARYRSLAAAHCDWLLGRNPWGFTMFTQVGSSFPRDPHLMTQQLTGRAVRGGLVDGPVYAQIFKSLRGVSITEPDPLARFQGAVVYHDDQQDYSSNEPTMDGTASAILLWAVLNFQ